MMTPLSNVENSPTFSSKIFSCLKDRTLLFSCLAAINLILSAWYLHWRITHSINSAALWLSIPLLLAEIYTYFGGVLFLIGLWRPIVRQVKSLNQLTPPFPVSEWPTVDVFITCHNEPVEMVETTIRAALAIDYPVTKLCVYVVDDGNSSAIGAMAEKLGLEDLKSPLLHQEVERVNKERSQLVTRLRQIENLTPEISKAEQLLQSFQLQVKTDDDVLPQVLSWFDQLQQPSIPTYTWLECKTVLAEGFDNVLRHAHKGLPPETPIHLEVTILTQSIQLRIWDYGLGFDLERHLQQQPNEVDEMAESGRGTGIMQQLSDYLSYTKMVDNRNCLLMIKSYCKISNSINKDYLESINGYLQSFRELIILFNSQNQPISNYLASEKRLLENSIYQKELDLRKFIRCRYIDRTQSDVNPHYANLGNINYALYCGETSGDFILTLDTADIPKPEVLERILPYFYTYNLYRGKYETNQTAFVQTPQAFYDICPNGPFGHQVDLFDGLIKQETHSINFALYAGKNALLSREALISVALKNFSNEFSKDEKKLDEFDLVGGMSSNSITEDLKTAMRLHAAGWKSVYHNQLLSQRLAPYDLNFILKQRLHWAQETISVLLRENLFTKSGLPFWQQLQYFQVIYSYFSGFATVIFIACPLIYFFTEIIPVRSYGLDFALHFIPALIFNRLTFMVAAWGIPARKVWRSEQCAIALFPLFIQAVWNVFTEQCIKSHFKAKECTIGGSIGLVWPQLTILALTILGMLWCTFRFATGTLENPWLYLLNSAWAIYHLSLFWVIIHPAVCQPKSASSIEISS